AEGKVCEVAFGSSAESGAQNAPANPTSRPRETVPAARATLEVLTALADARAVIVGPSNPVISIWPILSVLGEALAGLTAPVVCVSPVVGGEIVKGPTKAFLEAYEQPLSAVGVAAFYEMVQPGLLDGMIADEPTAGVAMLEIDTAMPDGATRARVAEQTLAFADSLAG
ncbi:MAG: 2-phospho-L-lactate transferase CofD family protein, partial [Solirubrobacteraceae bacterium]